MPPAKRKVDIPVQLPKEARDAKPLGRAPKKVVPKTTVRSDGATGPKQPTDGSTANTKSDQLWVDAAMAKGELKIIEDDRDVPLFVRMEWTGKAEDWGSALQMPDHPSRCTGRAFVRDGEGRRIIDSEGAILTRPCSAWRMRGSNVCGSHGGLTDGGKAIAQRRLTEAADMTAGHLIKLIEDAAGLIPDDIRLRAINSLLDRAGIKGGVEVTIEAPEWQQMLRTMWEEDGTKPASPAPDAKPAPRKRASRTAAKES